MLREVRYEYQHGNCWLQETTEQFSTLTLVVSSVYMTGDQIHVDGSFQRIRRTCPSAGEARSISS